MSQVIKKIKKQYEKSKLAGNKAMTNLGLRIFSRNKNVKNIYTKKNIFYGPEKLQKYDVIFPQKAIGNLPIVFYIHGGAWCGGDKYGYTTFCKNLAKQGYAICNVDYRLMPKVSVKTCVQDCILATKHFARHADALLKEAKINAKIDMANTFFVGDSAGAHLSSLLAGLYSTQTQKNKFCIKALGLYYGVYDFEHLSNDPSPLMRDLEKYWLDNEKNPQKILHYISSTNYVTKNFPPCFLTSGEIDKLHFQTEVFAKLLKYNGIETDYLCFDKSRLDAEHAFLNAGFLPSAKLAFERLTKFFEKKRTKNAQK